MRRISASLAAVVLTFPFLAWPAVAAERVPLAIGNAVYDHARGSPTRSTTPPMSARRYDGSALSSRLENAGYTALRRGLLECTRAALVAEIAMVFYAGHGIEVDRRNFLVPVDPRLLSHADIEFETLPLQLVSPASIAL